MSIADIPPPKGLTPLEKTEYSAFLSVLAKLELEWKQFKENKNADQIKCHQVIDEIKAKRIAMEERKLEIRKSYIEAQRESEMKKVDEISKEFKSKLFCRIMFALKKAYESNVEKLESKMDPKEFKEFMKKNAIEFPIMEDIEKETDYKEILEKTVDMKEITKDIKQIKEMLQKVTGVHSG